MCCSPWGRKESNTTERLNWTKMVDIGASLSKGLFHICLSLLSYLALQWDLNMMLQALSLSPRLLLCLSNCKSNPHSPSSLFPTPIVIGVCSSSHQKVNCFSLFLESELALWLASTSRMRQKWWCVSLETGLQEAFLSSILSWTPVSTMRTTLDQLAGWWKTIWGWGKWSYKTSQSLDFFYLFFF